MFVGLRPAVLSSSFCIIINFYIGIGASLVFTFILIAKTHAIITDEVKLCRISRPVDKLGIPTQVVTHYIYQVIHPHSHSRVVRAYAFLSCRLWLDSESGLTNDCEIVTVFSGQ